METLAPPAIRGSIRGSVGAISLSNTYLECFQILGVTLEAVEHLAHRHALDSVLVLDQDHIVGSDQTGVGQSL